MNPGSLVGRDRLVVGILAAHALVDWLNQPAAPEPEASSGTAMMSDEELTGLLEGVYAEFRECYTHPDRYHRQWMER